MRFIGLCMALTIPFAASACATDKRIAIPQTGLGHTWITGEKPDPSRIDVDYLGISGLSKPNPDPASGTPNNYDAIKMIGTQCLFLVDQMELSDPPTYHVAVVRNDGNANAEPHQQLPEATPEFARDFETKYQNICQ